MGSCCSRSDAPRPEEIYASLVIPKPPPVEINQIHDDSSDSIPLFATAQSDDDLEISDDGLEISESDKAIIEEIDATIKANEEEEEDKNDSDVMSPVDDDTIRFEKVSDDL